MKYFNRKMKKIIERLEGYDVSRKVVEKYYSCQDVRYSILKNYSPHKFKENRFKLCVLDMSLLKTQASCLKTIFQELSSENLLHRFEFFFPEEDLEPIKLDEVIQQLDDIIIYYSDLLDQNSPNSFISVDREVFLDNHRIFKRLIDSLYHVYVGRETSSSGEDIVFYLPRGYKDKLQALKIEVVEKECI